LLFHACSAQHETQEQQPGARRQWQQQNECQIRRINPQEPDRSIKSEAGVTEVWDENDDQFQCAGVAAVRHTIEQRGLLLPAYSNAPKLIYVDQGRGFHGAAFPGCPETYQSEEESQQEQRQGSRDQHQKVREIRRGDVIAIPAGVVDWFYNDAQSPLVLVQIFDTSSSDNQLDQNFRKFFLAGNPQRQVQGQRGQQSRHLHQAGEQHRGQQGQRSGNIFQAIDEQFLAEAFNIDTDLARRIKSENDNRGIIVRVQQELEFLSPRFSQQERQSRREGGDDRYNGIEETFCTAKLKVNIDDPSRADVFNPRAGRLTTVNSFNLPILRQLQLSAQKGFLYRNALMTPHWNTNAHSVAYITRGSGQVQIVNENGESVFDGQVQQGQIITAPQGFAVIKRAGNEGLEWVAFKTNDNAKINQIAGRASTIRAIPRDVLAHAFGVSREEAQRIKFSRREVSLFSPGNQSQQ
ncbi:cupin domain-containing protein, partial [Brucella melitensis]|uniref:cupin domain-containing protein n=1 Tax=Brucella melitensis TaxID=29459 RepID=UPI0028D3D24B